MSRLLLTTPVGPYDTHYYNHSLTDVMDQRFSRGCGIFTLRGHIHINFAHVLAQNIRTPTVFLEYPSWSDFEAELATSPTHIGINGFHNQRDVVIAMCKRARQLAPKARILLGGWSAIAIGAIYSEAEWKAFADALCTSEGIGFLRRELGEDTAAPIQITHLPRCSAALPWLEPHPPGDMGTVVASLGCPNGCDFCGTTHMYERRRLRLLSARQTFDEFIRYFRDNPNLLSVNLVEEDSFADKPFMEELARYIQEDREFGLERINFFCLASNQSLSSWDFDDILRTGLSSVFVGVESKFAPDNGYKKRRGRDIDETFRELHRRGIATIGAWVGGFDFQTRENIADDLESFVALEPTFQQLTRLCPFPGTTLWRQVADAGVIDPKRVPCESISFFGGGGMKPKHFHDHEIMDIIDRGYVRLYETWGANLFRQWKVAMNGFEYCRQHPDALIRRRATFFRNMAIQLYPLARAMEVYAPNPTVRKRVRDQRARYASLFGEPTLLQRVGERLILAEARKAQRREREQPANVYPKEEPFKRYEYDRRQPAGSCPYVVTHPHRELTFRLYDVQRRARFGLINGIARVMAGGGKITRSTRAGILPIVAPAVRAEPPATPAAGGNGHAKVSGEGKRERHLPVVESGRR